MSDLIAGNSGTDETAQLSNTTNALQGDAPAALQGSGPDTNSSTGGVAQTGTGETGAQPILSAAGTDVTAAVASPTSTTAVTLDSAAGAPTTQVSGDTQVAGLGEPSSSPSSGAGGTDSTGNGDDGSATLSASGSSSLDTATGAAGGDEGNAGGAASTAAGSSASATSSSAVNAPPVTGTQGNVDDTGSDVHPHVEATGIVSRLRTAVQSAEAEVRTALEAEFARLEQLIELLKRL